MSAAPPPPWSLRAERAALGLTQAALAARLGVSVETVWRWERARRRDSLLRLALRGLAAELWREHMAGAMALVRRGAALTEAVGRRNQRTFGQFVPGASAEFAAAASEPEAPVALRDSG